METPSTLPAPGEGSAAASTFCKVMKPAFQILNSPLIQRGLEAGIPVQDLHMTLEEMRFMYAEYTKRLGQLLVDNDEGKIPEDEYARKFDRYLKIGEDLHALISVS